MSKITHDYKFWGTGELGGETSATQCPDIDCKTVLFKAAAANTGNVYIGASGVTAKDGTTDTTTGYQLDAGQEVRFFVGNMSECYYICDGAGDDLTYQYMG